MAAPRTAADRTRPADIVTLDRFRGDTLLRANSTAGHLQKCPESTFTAGVVRCLHEYWVEYTPRSA